MRLIKKQPDENQVLFFADDMFQIALIHVNELHFVKILFIDKHPVGR